MGEKKTIDVSEIIKLHEQSILDWKLHGISYKSAGFLSLVEQNHGFNYQLWHAEDKARREDKGHTFVYHAKRAIDSYNQKRNDFMEAIDDHLMISLQPESSETCPVHSETPGMMIDRLSILALKHYHMEKQTMREEVDDAHRHHCLQKLSVIAEQRIQLAVCLDILLTEIVSKKRTFRIYRQFKMYNSSELNPELYSYSE